MSAHYENSISDYFSAKETFVLDLKQEITNDDWRCKFGFYQKAFRTLTYDSFTKRAIKNICIKMIECAYIRPIR